MVAKMSETLFRAQEKRASVGQTQNDPKAYPLGKLTEFKRTLPLEGTHPNRSHRPMNY